jgi:hypothetical protein
MRRWSTHCVYMPDDLIVMLDVLIMAVSSAKTRASYSATQSAAARLRAIPFTLFASLCRDRARRPLFGNYEFWRHRLQVQNLSNKIAQRDHQRSSLYRATGGEFSGGRCRQPYLLLGTQENDVGQRSFDCVPNASGTIGTTCSIRRSLGRVIGHAIRVAFQIPKVGRIDGEIAGEGATQRLVGGNQCSEAFVDLAVLPLAALLNRLHCEQPNAHADERNHAQAQQSGKQSRPGSEV